MYAHPKRLTATAVARAKLELLAHAKIAREMAGFHCDHIEVRVSKHGGFVTYVNALGTIRQHHTAALELRAQGIGFGFSYRFPGDPFTRTKLIYPLGTPESELDRESVDVVELLKARAEGSTNG